ncbi:MAG: hypothetical protein JWL71_1893 [Acidobacteria bacterium]|nr:hypothetical protein [Acidobacteriota bacterium]
MTFPRMAATLSGADKIAADKNPQCQLFTPADFGSNSIVAEISGGGATEASAIALLKETIKREAGQ